MAEFFGRGVCVCDREAGKRPEKEKQQKAKDTAKTITQECVPEKKPRESFLGSVPAERGLELSAKKPFPAV